ncbi:hypothetical protein RUND412_000644 [Rhizina undulata]
MYSYTGDREVRDRSRGSRDRGLEPDYGRLNDRPDADWHGRGRGRSPGSLGRLPPRRRSRSPLVGGNIDRYVPRSPPLRRSRSPSRPRFDLYPHPPALPLQPAKAGTIDRYVPQNNGAPQILADPHKLEYQVTYNYFSDWYHQEFGSEGVKKEDVKQKYDEYREDLSARTARSFVAAHKNDEWFKERYVPGEKEIAKAKIAAFRRASWAKWKSLMTKGALDCVDRESKVLAGRASGEDANEGTGEEVEEVNRGVDDGGLRPVLLIKTISPTVSRVQLEELASTNVPNFNFISLSDPNPLKKFHRIGFIILNPIDPSDPTSDPIPVDEATVELLNGKSIHDEMHGAFMCHVGIHNGPTNAKIRKVLNEAMSMPENLKKEVQLIEKCILKLEAELRTENYSDEVYDGWETIRDYVEEWGRGEREKRQGSEEEGEEGNDEEIQLKMIKKTIDLGVEYLRRVFNFCLYCVSSSDSIHELTRKCPGGHIRRPTPSPEFVPDTRTVNWTRVWQEKLELFVNPPMPEDEDYSQRLKKLGGKPAIEALEEEMQKHVKKEDEGKFRCKVSGCTKLFKAEEFWRKHIEKKHLDWFNAVQNEASLVNNYVLDPCRVHPPKVEQNNQGGFTSNMQGGNRNFPMLSIAPFGGPGAFPPPPNFTFNPSFIPHSGDKYVPNHNHGPGLLTPDVVRRDGLGGAGPMRRRDNRAMSSSSSGGNTGAGALPRGTDRYGPYPGRRDRSERERERERRDREMREARASPGGASGSAPAPRPAGGEAELAVLGRSMKSYMDLDATGGEKKAAMEELDY